MKNWKDIWAGREAKGTNLTATELLNLNGYDNERSRITPATLQKAKGFYKQVMDWQPSDSIYEVGCGSGAFLHREWYEGTHVGGMDLSQALVDIANSNLPGGNFTVDEAINLTSTEKFDHIMSFSVFFYFPTMDYAEEVILTMLAKANKSVSIYDLQDMAYVEENEAMRRESYGSNYDKDYEGLSHLYFDKSWFIKFAKDHNLHLTIFDQIIDGYECGKYRFNVTMKPNRR
jgi:trans-aconitate methyltransferase